MKQELSASALAAVLLALAQPTASAQSVIFHEDFENGSAAWTLQGDWHLAQVSSLTTCGITNPEAPSGLTAARFAEEGQCYFNVPPGRLRTASPIAIPANVQAARVRFTSYEATECGLGNCGWDHRSLFVSADGGSSWDLAWVGGQEGLWIEKSVDLSNYRGLDILLAFEFDAIDGYGNHFLGWVVDDVTVEVDEQGGPTIYCAPKSNSQGCGPLMSYSGDPSFSGPDDLVLSTSNLRNNVYGSFAWSTGINNTPFQGGTLCVQIPARRTTTISTGGTPAPKLDCSGSYAWLFSHDYLTVNGIEPGETVHCQFFGRDVGTGAPMTLSDAARVTILP
jgi:hypothetical protein